MKTRFIALAGLAIVAAACNKENVPQANENGRVTVSFNASPADTKVVYTEDAAGEYYNIDWSENEEVGLYAFDTADPSIHSELFKFTRVHDNVFSGEVVPWQGGRTIVGVWPFDSGRVVIPMPENSLGLSSPAVFVINQHAAPVTVPAGDDEYGHTLLLASGSDRSYDKIGNLEFTQIYSIVKMNVTGVPDGVKVESVEVRSSGEVKNGKTISVIGYVDLLEAKMLATQTFQILQMDVSGTENGQDCVINLPLFATTGLSTVGAPDGDKYTFVVKLSNGTEVEKTLANKVIFKAGHVYKLNMPLQDLGVKDLSADGIANCYVVDKYGPCKFDATKKGNSSESVGTIASAEVLWESFGDDVQPAVGDIVKDVTVQNGIVSFTASGKDGNAVIAVKDAAGEILWSWHIWVCKDFDLAASAQVYNNNAGTVMDRNLGATSATKGDVHALGLLYQWGRKDPFLSGESISSDNPAKSTITWPSTVSTDSSNGTIDFVVKHPTTFVARTMDNSDWYHTDGSSTDNTRNTRWTSDKTMYDPCPKGWRVPDGGDNGLWAKAFGTSEAWTTSSNWDSTNIGMDFGSTDKKLGSGEVWYPASGCLWSTNGTLSSVGNDGHYWSCTPNINYSYTLSFYSYAYIIPSLNYGYRAYGQSVRCVAE